MNRSTSYLLGFIAGGLITGFALAGHANDWVSAGPVFGLIVFGCLAIGAFSMCAVLDDENK